MKQRLAFAVLAIMGGSTGLAAQPDLFQFNGFIQPDVKTCVSALRAACEDQFQGCEVEDGAVFYTDEETSISMLCTASGPVGGAVFSVAAAGQSGQAERLTHILTRMKEVIDKRFE